MSRIFVTEEVIQPPKPTKPAKPVMDMATLQAKQQALQQQQQQAAQKQQQQQQAQLQAKQAAEQKAKDDAENDKDDQKRLSAAAVQQMSFGNESWLLQCFSSLQGFGFSHEAPEVFGPKWSHIVCVGVRCFHDFLA